MPIYMQIEGGKVEGESKDDGHEKWIDILSMSGAVSNNGTFAMGGGGGRGRSQLADLSVLVNEGKSSPGLFQACCDGTHFKDATLHFTKSGGAQEVYMKWELTNVLVSSYSISGSGEDVPTDSVTFNFEKIKYTYLEQDEKGKVSVAAEATWDQGKNKAI
ncbi:MAG: type VI secretion system tube protein Hcp [Pseudomonadota bacterium]